jgi:hypothetical protein
MTKPAGGSPLFGSKIWADNPLRNSRLFRELLGKRSATLARGRVRAGYKMIAAKGCAMTKSDSPLNAEADRRAFLGTAAGILVPPAMVMLLSTSLASPAIAASGGVGVAGGGSGNSGSRGGFSPALPIAGAGAAGAAALPASGAAAAAAGVPAAATAPVDTASSSMATAPAAAPTTASPFAAAPYRAAPTPRLAPVGVPPVVLGGPGRTLDRRSLAIRRAGERG